MRTKLEPRYLLAVLIAVLTAMVLAAPTDAGRKWCRHDPVFLVAGVQVNVEGAIPEENEVNVAGPMKVVLIVPVGVSTSLV